MIAGCRRYIYRFSVQGSHEACIFSFGINDDNIIISCEKYVKHFTLSGKALAAARRTEYKTVWIFQIQPVEKYHIIGQRIESVVHTVLLIDLL